MRLAYLVSQYPAVSHTFVLREVRRLREAGFDIRVASVNPPDRAAEHLTAEEREEAAAAFVVKRQSAAAILHAHLEALFTRPRGYVRGLAYALRLGGTDLRRALYGLFYFVEAVLLAQWMRRNHLEHLHVHFATPASTVALIARRAFPISFSLTVHGPDEFYDAPGYHLSEKVAAADFVCCIGAYARSQLMKLSPPEHWEKLLVAPLGVDPDLFGAQPLRERPEPFEVLCVGRLVPAKGQHVLVAAVERLLGQGRRVRLRLVGDGADRDSLARAVREKGLEAHVVFEGALNPDRTRALYARADAFALASFAEGIPVVLMEAMAMGVPCVTTWITGIPELIRDGVDGLLVPPADDAALADALARLMDDAALRRRLSMAGRARVREKYDLARNTARLAAIFLSRVPRRPDAVGTPVPRPKRIAPLSCRPLSGSLTASPAAGSQQ